MKNLPKINPSKALKASLPYLIAGLLCTKLGEAYRLTTGGDVIDRLLAAFTKLGLVFQNPFPSLHPFDLLVGAAAAVLLRLVVWSKIKNAKKYRHGEEYGTARWGNEKDIAPFINSDFSQNILLTDTERLTLGKIADPEKRNVNLNVLVIGGSGSGKTRYHIKPNLLQMNASYVCSDPKGTVVEEVGRALVQQGHYIPVIKAACWMKSCGYFATSLWPFHSSSLRWHWCRRWIILWQVSSLPSGFLCWRGFCGWYALMQKLNAERNT